MKTERISRRLYQIILPLKVHLKRQIAIGKDTGRALLASFYFFNSLYKLHFRVLWHAAATESRQR